MSSLSETPPQLLPATARLLFASPYLHLAVDAQQRWLYACWQGNIGVEELQEGVEQVIAAVRELGIAKLLNDNRYLNILGINSATWRGMDTMQQLHAVGLHYIAWIYAPNLQARHLADEATEKSAWPLTLTFEEYDMAQDWLQNVE